MEFGYAKAGVAVSGAVAFLLSLVYVVRVLYDLSRASMSNLDVQNFWEQVHPRLGVSILPSIRMPNATNLSGLTQDEWTQIYRNYDYDPRVVPALWVSRISSQLQNTAFLEPGFGLPFLWDALLGISLSPDFQALSGTSANCLFLFLGPYDQTLLESVCRDSLRAKGPPVEISGPVDAPLSAPVRKYVGANYLYYSQQNPSRLVFLGILELTSSALPSLVLTTSNGDSKNTLACMVRDYLEENPEPRQISIVEQLARLKKIMNDTKAEKALPASLPHEQGEDIGTSLSPDDFDPEITNVDRACASTSQSELALQSTPTCSVPPGKYFHEAELAGTHIGFHYDWRFFRTTKLSDYERKVVLHRLAKAWLRFSRSAKLKTWLAHGTLLGWYWNGMSLPWDQDMDVQTTYESIEKMARLYNQSLVVDLCDDPDVAGVHLYFLDVSPHYRTRTFQDGDNVIDARFIDTDTGIYVDITALAISTTYQQAQETQRQAAGRLHALFQPDYRDLLQSAHMVPGKMIHSIHLELEAREQRCWESRHLYNCKDLHFHRLDELGPLRPTAFEGEAAYVPREFQAVLRREYPKGLTSRVYGDWVFRPFFGVWTPLYKCRNDLYGSECRDKNMILEEKFTRLYRLKREHWYDCVVQEPRVDPYIIRRNNALKLDGEQVEARRGNNS